MQDNNKKIGIHQLYAQDPEAADKLLWDREADPIAGYGDSFRCQYSFFR